MSNLVEFLLARIAEDEEAAREAAEPDAFGEKRSFYSGPGPHCDDWGLWTLNVPPARMLAECEAKRRIVELHAAQPLPAGAWQAGKPVCAEDDNWWPCGTLKLLALPYADHPAYDEAWRP